WGGPAWHEGIARHRLVDDRHRLGRHPPVPQHPLYPPGGAHDPVDAAILPAREPPVVWHVVHVARHHDRLAARQRGEHRHAVRATRLTVQHVERPRGPSQRRHRRRQGGRPLDRRGTRPPPPPPPPPAPAGGPPG